MRRRLAIIALLLTACASGPESELRGGRAALERGDYRAAAEQLEAALAEPQGFWDRYETLTELGEVYLSYVDLGREQRAGEFFRLALEMTVQELRADHPAHLDALEKLGRYYTITGGHGEARPLLEEYLQLAARSVDPQTLYQSPASRALLDTYNQLDAREEYEALRARQRDPLVYARDDGIGVEEFSPADLCTGPNARDAQGRAAFAHFTRADMPLRVSFDEPQTSARDSSQAETLAAAKRGIHAWHLGLRRLFPWFEIRYVAHGEPAHVEVEFKRRGRYYLPAVGEILIRPDGHAAGRVVLAPQPIPNGTNRVPRGELTIWTTHAFGSAIGLVDCWHEDSVMSTNWRRAARFQVTDRDIRAFEALLARPHGESVATLVGDAPGVLAELPMINSGDGADLLIDIAPPGARSFPTQLDTGATHTVLTTNYARALGITVRRIKSDPYQRATVTGDQLRFWVTAQGGGTESRHFGYALLGGEYLSSYVLDLDFARRRVRFLDPEIHDLRDEISRLPGEQLVPLEIRSTWPFARLELGNGSVWALVDTGAQVSIAITEEKAHELGIEIDPEAERVRFLNVLGTSVEYLQPLPEARLGSLVLRDTQLQIGSRSESSVRIARWLQDETMVGLLVLRNYRVRIDYKHGVMGLTPIGGDAP
jgi:predicted aspartyl protease